MELPQLMTPLQRAIERIQALDNADSTPSNLFTLIFRRNNRGNANSTLNLSGLGLTSEDLESLLNNKELIPKLKNVRKLQLQLNKITAIPENIGLLQDLKHLNLVGNKIEKLSKGTEKLTGLKLLSLHGNELKDIDAKFLPPNLTRLDARGNHITKIPTGLSDKLEWLDLGYNDIEITAKDLNIVNRKLFLDVAGNKLDKESALKLARIKIEALKEGDSYLGLSNMSLTSEALEEILKDKELKANLQHFAQFIEDFVETKHTHRYSNGDIYEGQWKGGKRHGKGTFKYVNGYVYEGQWENNNRHGKGTFKYVNGYVYEGQWENNNRHGEGTLKYVNGDIYCGEWICGIKSYGTLTKADGSSLTGYWENGRLTECSSIVNQTNFKENKEIHTAFRDVKLKEFLLKTTPLTNDRKEALNHLLGKLLIEDKAENYKTMMKIETGNCGTPVKDFLTQMLVNKYREEGKEIPEALIAKIAVGDYLGKNLKEFDIQGGEAIERKQGFLNALFLEGSESNQGNKHLKIGKKPYFRDSDTNYSFYPGEKESIQFAKMFCKTNESGNLIRENGCYLADKEKIDEITDLYRIDSGTEEAKIPSMKKAGEIADKVVNEYFSRPDIDGLPNQGFGKKDDDILIVNKAIKDMVKQDPKLDIEKITADDVIEHLVGKPSNTVEEPRTWWTFFSEVFSATSCCDGR
jgi:hypothetical protein